MAYQVRLYNSVHTFESNIFEASFRGLMYIEVFSIIGFRIDRIAYETMFSYRIMRRFIYILNNGFRDISSSEQGRRVR